MIVEPKETQYRTVSAIPTYSHLKPGSSKISIGLRNYSCRQITVKAKSTVATISAANAVLGNIALKESGENISEEERQGKMPPKLTQEQLNKSFDKIRNLGDLSQWDGQKRINKRL